MCKKTKRPYLLKCVSCLILLFILKGCNNDHETEVQSDLNNSITDKIIEEFENSRVEVVDEYYGEFLELSDDISSFEEAIVVLNDPEYLHLENYLSEFTLLKLRDLINEYDERLEPFTEDFFNQINSIIVAFTDTIYHHDSSHLSGFISDGTALIENSSIFLDREISRVLRLFSIPKEGEQLTWEGIADSMLGVSSLFSEQALFYSDYRIEGRSEPFLATYLRRADNNSLNIQPILISDVIMDRPILRGVEVSYFPEIILIFGAMAIESPFDSRNFVSYIVHLNLESMEYKIIIIYTE